MLLYAIKVDVIIDNGDQRVYLEQVFFVCAWSKDVVCFSLEKGFSCFYL